MGVADYSALRQAIATQIGANITTTGVQVAVEKEFAYNEKWVGIYVGTRDAPDGEQWISYGRRTRMFIPVQIWVWAYGMQDSIAMSNRDSLLGDVELSLLLDHTFSNVAETSWFDTVKFQSGKDPMPGKFWAGASLDLVCRMSVLVQ